MARLTHSTQLISQPATAECESVDPSLLWFRGEGPKEKISYLDAKAKESGLCYVRLLIFCSRLALLPQDKFVHQVERFVDCLGKLPLGRSVFPKLLVFGSSALVGPLETDTDSSNTRKVRSEMSKGKARVKVIRDEGSGLLHIEPLLGHPFCECRGSSCRHGWNFKLCEVAMTLGDRRVGASGFCMEAFFEEMNEIEEGFDETFSQVTPTPDQCSRSARQVENWNLALDTEQQPLSSKDHLEPIKEFHHPRSAGAAPDQLRVNLSNSKCEQDKVLTLERRLKALAEMVELQADIAQRKHFGSTTPPLSPPESHSSPRTYQESLRPADSSSSLSRYGRHYMPAGTVFTVSNSGNTADTAENRTRLTLSNHLIDGFQKTEQTVKRETSSVAKLRPINGLPRPFVNNRLNFLCNIHTAITLKLRKYHGSHLDAMYNAMRAKPTLPVDNLLYQVLNATVDRRDGIYTSNAFELPYIEVGMLFTEESIVKMFDLLHLEYKRLWFQEMKNLIVPNFHSDYKSIPSTVLGNRRSRSTERPKSKPKFESKSRKGGRSLLGIPM